MAGLNKNLAIALTEPVEDAYNACIDRLLINICKHLGTGKAYRTADWELQKLSDIGRLTEENARIIREAVKQVPQEVRDALEEASRVALEDIEKFIEDAISQGAIERASTDSVKELLQGLLNQSIDKLNLVNTTMLESSQNAYLNAVTEIAFNERAALNVANELAVSTALRTETRNQALKKAISQMLDNGLYGFVDRAGRRWSPEAYASMLIRTTSHNTAVDSIKARQQDYGSDIFQVSTHPGARPLCYPYQGKFYTWGNEGGTFTEGQGARHTYKPISSTSYGKAAGLFGINCGHYPLPVIPRVSIPQQKKEQDKVANDKEYRESQEQRALERDIREAKRKEVAYREAGLLEAADEQKKEVSERQKTMRDFISRTGRTRRYDRENVR